MLFEVSTARAIVAIIQALFSITLIAIVLLQSGKRSGLSGAIAGGADTFLNKNQARTWDSKFAKATKWVAIVFILLSLTLMLMP